MSTPITLEQLRTFFHRSPFMADLGVEPVHVEPGRVRTELLVQPRFGQHSGVVHAGVLVAMVDHTMGSSAQTLAAAGHHMLTVEIKTSLLRGAPGAAGTRLVCEGWVVKPGRSLSFTEGEVWTEAADGARTVLIRASATMMAAASRA